MRQSNTELLWFNLYPSDKLNIRWMRIPLVKANVSSTGLHVGLYRWVYLRVVQHVHLSKQNVYPSNHEIMGVLFLEPFSSWNWRCIPLNVYPARYVGSRPRCTVVLSSLAAPPVNCESFSTEGTDGCWSSCSHVESCKESPRLSVVFPALYMYSSIVFLSQL